MESNRKITKSELEEHKSDGDIWVCINGKVYDLSKFYLEHPGGANVIKKNAGIDCTTAFEDAQHDKASLKKLETFYLGEFTQSRLFTKLEEIADHNVSNDLWLLIKNKVYDVSRFKHPGK